MTSAHANCSHESSKAARAACRRGRAKVLAALANYLRPGDELDRCSAQVAKADGTMLAIRADVSRDRAGWGDGPATDFDGFAWVASEVAEAGLLGDWEG